MRNVILTSTLDLSEDGLDHWLATGQLRTTNENHEFSIMNPQHGREEIDVDFDEYEVIEADAATDEEELRAVIGEYEHASFGPATVQVSVAA